MTPLTASLDHFDPNSPGMPGSLFGLPFSEAESSLVIIPVPWEATVSFGTGTALAPRAIMEASLQVDLFVKNIPDAWKAGIYMASQPKSLASLAQRSRTLAALHIEQLGRRPNQPHSSSALAEVNQACEELHNQVWNAASSYLEGGKVVAVLGGDHSVPLGLIRALADRHDRFGVLQIDAHADLRNAYEGFVYSHASIMHHVLAIPQVGRLVQVGLRDYCQEEYDVMQHDKARIRVFDDEKIQSAAYEGDGWPALCRQIIDDLPEKVYISFDIDGLDPSLCPHTGTPVPGGLSFYQATMLIEQIARSGRTIIGFDLNEVSGEENAAWDANVGARVLYALCNWTLVSCGRLRVVDPPSF